MSLLDNLPHRCSIFRQTRTRDSLGGHRYGVVSEQTNVECWQQPASDSEVMAYEKRGQVVTTKIYFSSNPNVTEQNRILITERDGVEASNTDITDPDNPDVFDVISVSQPDASAGLNILWRVMCRERTGATQ